MLTVAFRLGLLHLIVSPCDSEVHSALSCVPGSHPSQLSVTLFQRLLVLITVFGYILSDYIHNVGFVKENGGIRFWGSVGGQAAHTTPDIGKMQATV